MSRTICGARRGFTLIEVLVVVVVIGMLAGLVGPRIIGRVSEARTTTARTQVELLGLALDNYRLDNGGYPTTEQGLKALVELPAVEPVPGKWTQLMEEVPKDPWNMEFRYVYPAKRSKSEYDVFSLGRDGVESGDDIGNWKLAQKD